MSVRNLQHRCMPPPSGRKVPDANDLVRAGHQVACGCTADTIAADAPTGANRLGVTAERLFPHLTERADSRPHSFRSDLDCLRRPSVVKAQDHPGKKRNAPVAMSERIPEP